MMGTRNSVACLLLVLLCHVTGSDVAQRAADPVAQLKSVTDHLGSQVTKLTAQVTALSADLGRKASQISSLTTLLSQKTSLLNQLNRTVLQQINQLHSLDTYCKSQVSELSADITKLDTPIAFTTRFTNNSVIANTALVGHNQYLKFDFVQYQTGGTNYNHTTGLFTAPTTGTYAFFLTMQRNDPTQNDCLEATIMRNTNGWVTTVSACPSGYTSASNMAFTWLRAGDKVHVQTVDGAEIFGHIHTTFSGMKL